MVGAGVVGLSCAWALARRGVSVALVDPSPGRGASWVAAGMLAPVSEAHYGEESLVRLLATAAARWPAFATELEEASGRGVGYRSGGSLVVAADASDRRAIDDLVALPRHLGLEVRPLSGRACRDQVPALAPGVRGGAELPSDHQVDNRLLVQALLSACDRAQVALWRQEVVALERDPTGAACGVRLASGTRLAAGAVLVATGAHAAALPGVPEGILPQIRPVKGHVLRLRGPKAQPLLPRTIRGLVHGRSCYLVPRQDGSVVLGATVEERGFDRQVQAGAVHELLHDARALVPGIDELEFEEALAGLRPGSPDNAPFMGWTSLKGLAVASGHFRNGILLAPLTGEAMADVLGGAPLDAALALFDARRGVGV